MSKIWQTVTVIVNVHTVYYNNLTRSRNDFRYSRKPPNVLECYSDETADCCLNIVRRALLRRQKCERLLIIRVRARLDAANVDGFPISIHRYTDDKTLEATATSVRRSFRSTGRPKINITHFAEDPNFLTRA